MVVTLDLQATGVDPLRDRDLEFGIFQIGGGTHGASSNTVHVDAAISPRSRSGCIDGPLHQRRQCRRLPYLAMCMATFF